MGTKIPQDRWPPIYAKKYRITNLFKIDLSGGRRLVYEIARIEGKGRVRLIEYFRNHTEYER